jgi:hypothetical protein
VKENVMKNLTLIAALGFCLPALASNGNVFDVKLDVKNKYMNTSTHLLVEPGKTSAMTRRANGEDNFIEVDAQPSAADSEIIEMKVTMGTIGRDGSRNVLSTSEIKTKNLEPKEITTAADKTGETTQITVQPTRRTL